MTVPPWPRLDTTSSATPHPLIVQQAGCQVTHGSAHARKWLQAKTSGDEFEDGGRVVLRVVDVAFLHPWGDQDGGDAHAWPPTVSVGWRHVVPETTVFVVGHDDQRFVPLWTLTDLVDHRGDVRVASPDFSIAGVLVQGPLWFVEGHGGQHAVLDVVQEVGNGGLPANAGAQPLLEAGLGKGRAQCRSLFLHPPRLEPCVRLSPHTAQHLGSFLGVIQTIKHL